MSEVIRFTPPLFIAKELDAISELGVYKNKNDFILDAINTILSANRELRIAIACKLYEKEEISLGKTTISETKNRAEAVLKKQLFWEKENWV